MCIRDRSRHVTGQHFAHLAHLMPEKPFQRHHFVGHLCLSLEAPTWAWSPWLCLCSRPSPSLAGDHSDISSSQPTWKSRNCSQRVGVFPLLWRFQQAKRAPCLPRLQDPSGAFGFSDSGPFAPEQVELKLREATMFNGSDN